MPSPIRRLIGTAGMAAALAFSLDTAAQAGFVYDLEITPPKSFSGSGQITFDTLSGSAAAGISSFSFAGTAGLGVYIFDETDIATISWSIDAATSTLTLDLTTGAATVGSTISCLVLSNTASNNQCSFPFSFGQFPDAAIQQRIGFSTFSANEGKLTATAVITAVAEPAPLGLIGFSFVAVGVARILRWRAFGTASA